MNTPNKITISRLVIAIVMIFFLVFPWNAVGASVMVEDLKYVGFSIVDIIATVLFIGGSITDAVDGHIARKYNLITDFGKFFDPLADKFLVNSAFIVLACMGRIPAIFVVLMIGRDLAVDGIRFIAATKGTVIAANIFGKLKTVFQMVAIPFVMLKGFPLNMALKDNTFYFTWTLVGITCAMSLVSGFIYLYRGRHLLKEDDKKVEKIFAILEKENLYLGSVESLTGGLFAETITSVSGASKIYKGSEVTYCNELKIQFGVNKDTIDKYTAVSKETALEMAKCGIKKLNCDISISFTGNAGPDPSEGKPVGLVYIGIAIKDNIKTYELNLKGKRDSIRKQCIDIALNNLLEELKALYPEEK